LLAGAPSLGAENAASYQTLLETIPWAPERAVQVWLNDYAAAAAALDVTRPAADATDDAVETYCLALSAGGVQAGPFISGFHSYAGATLPGLRQRAGYDVRDVRASLQDLANLPTRHAAVTLDVSPNTVLSTIAHSSAWPVPEVREHGGVSLLIWSPVFTLGLEQRLNAPVFDELGRAAPLAFWEAELLSASSVDQTEAMIDARLGLTASLWDAEMIRRLAEGLAKLGAYSCVLSNDPSSQDIGALPSWSPALSPAEMERLSENVDAHGTLRAYEAFGVGVGSDEAGIYMALVLVHEEEAIASDNASHLLTRLRKGESLAYEAPWATWFDVERTVIEVDGADLLAKVPILPTASAGLWVRWLLQRDPLLLFRGD